MRGASFARAFTLVELLISASIITIISGVVLVRFSAFDSTVILKSLAYEVAMSIREAQVYSLSVICAGGTCDNVGDALQYRFPYGMTFAEDDVTYKLFQYVGTDLLPQYDIITPDATVVRTYQLGRGIVINDVCVDTGSIDPDCGITRLDVSFRRPEFTPLFYATGLAGGKQPGDIRRGFVKLNSPQGDNVWVVEVGTLGNISVYKQP